MSPVLRLRVEPSEIEASSVKLTGDRFHYLSRVRRVAVGDPVELFDGGGRSRSARVASASAEWMVLDATGELERVEEPPCRIVSLVPLIKGERMDFAIAKLTELGVGEIVPFRCERSVVALVGERADRRVARFNRVAEDAARQCGRSELPRIGAIRDYAAALDSAGDCAARLVFAPMTTRGLREHLGPSSGDAPASLALLTGPEGGLTISELEHAAESGFELIGLGPRILRAETAAMTAAAAVLALVGDIGRGR